MPLSFDVVRQIDVRIESLERLVTKQLARHSQYPIISGAEIIEFTIISVDEVALTALVQVDARLCGRSSATDEDTIGQLTVNDPQGCHLKEPEPDLLGREGWAARMTNDATGDCQWDVFSLCCPDCT